MAARTDHSIRRRLRKAGAIAFRLFVVYSLIYTLFSLLLDSRSTDYLGISETACTAQFIDADSPEELRQRLIDEFAPTLVFSFGEPADLEEEVVVAYQLVPDREETGRYVWRGAVTYPTDYGATSFGARFTVGDESYSVVLSKSVLRFMGWLFGQAHVDAHIGDVEMFELYLAPSDDAGHWAIDQLQLFAHGNAKVYGADQIHCFRGSPILYVSRGKHAMYPSIPECNNSSVANQRGVHLIAEYCSIGTLYYPSTSPEFDVGDSATPNNIFATSPAIRATDVFAGEDAWGTCFTGGHQYDEPPNPCRSRFRWW